MWILLQYFCYCWIWFWRLKEKSYIFIRHRLITWNKMGEKRRPLKKMEIMKIISNISSIIMAPGQSVAWPVHLPQIPIHLYKFNAFSFLFIFELMSCVCVFSSELRFVWPSCFGCKISGWPKMCKLHFCFFTSLFWIRFITFIYEFDCFNQ